MSALGHKATWRLALAMSGLPLKEAAAKRLGCPLSAPDADSLRRSIAPRKIPVPDRQIRSALPVIRENVISCLRCRVAREPALAVVRLRRLVSHGAEREHIGRGVILEHGPPPSALSANLLRSFTIRSTSFKVPGTVVSGKSWFLFGFQWIFAILEPSGKGLPLAGTPAR
jgi:hypothetical protein